MATKSLVKINANTPAVRGASEIESIRQLDMRLDLVSDIITGFNGPIFTGKVSGSSGDLNVSLIRNHDPKKDSVVFEFSPLGDRNPGVRARIEHNLETGGISLAKSELHRNRIETFKWFGDEEQPGSVEIYRRAMTVLLPKMRYAGLAPEYLKFVGGDESKAAKSLEKAGEPSPEKLLEELKEKVRLQLAKPIKNEELPKLK